MYSDDYLDEYEEEFVESSNSKLSFNFDKRLIILIVVLVILVSIYIIYTSISKYHNSYEYLELKLEESAKQYVYDNNISGKSEFFIESSKLEPMLKEGCSNLSGVFVKDESYQAYLSCNDYETKILDNSDEYISLNGKDVFFLAKGMEYVESSYVENKSVTVNINGNVGTETGVYEVKYMVVENLDIVDVLTRKVVVINDNNIKSFYPTLQLNGDRIEYLEVLDNYDENGAIGFDSVDGKLDNIKIESNLDITVDGEYQVNYFVTNSRGYSAAATRKIIVAKSKGGITSGSIMSPITLTNQNVKITISVFGDEYAYTVLPNGLTTDEKTFEYMVEENGDYKFTAFDKSGNSIIENVNVNNIDRTPPNGTCNVKIYSDYSDISIQATSDKGISGYNYIINGSEMGYTNSITYKLNTSNVSSVSVRVKDILGNEALVNCSLQKMDPTIGNNNVTYLTKYNTQYVVVNTKASVTSFEKAVRNKISQNASSAYDDKCLGFAEYHVCKIVKGITSGMNADDAAAYRTGCRLKDHQSTKEEVLKKLYEEINAGYPVVLMVNGNKARTSRHFVMAIGYKRGVYKASDLKEEDLLIIDSYDGKMESMDPNIMGSSHRSMFKQNGKYRLRYYSR